ncbi:MAG: PEP-CTERM sorting domain-containing protein [Planctomycetes bacterium]|nr:PEP-CTERM sorting domain-containing protein [Planctomycetota bacterium]
MSRRDVLFVSILLFLGLLVAPQSVEAGTLIGSGLGVLYDVDHVTGLASNPRDTGGRGIRIAFGNGTLYGESALHLYSIEVENGGTTSIGSLGGLDASFSVQDLAWDRTTDMLFALVHLGGTTSDFLYAVDADTGDATEIGQLDAAYTTMAFRGDGTLFALHGTDDILGLVDKTSAETLSSVPVQGGVIPGAMSFDAADELYVAARVGDDLGVLHKLDRYTGVLTPIGSTGVDVGLTSMAYIPEPGTLVLLSAGLLSFRRRK